MSGTDSVAQPSDERQTNRTRRPVRRKTPRAPFPLTVVSDDPEPEVRGAQLLTTSDLDTSDPAAGGGRGFTYEWESTAQSLEQQIASVGGSVASFTYRQSAPAATWVIDHHLGLIPNVLIVDDSGQQLIAEIRHPSDQTTVVLHSAPYSGTAYLRP